MNQIGIGRGAQAIILASLAYGFVINTKQIHIEGIQEVTASDIRLADALGYRIKLVATIRANEGSLVEVHVRPTLVAKHHVLPSVNGAFNAFDGSRRYCR